MKTTLAILVLFVAGCGSTKQLTNKQQFDEVIKIEETQNVLFADPSEGELLMYLPKDPKITVNLANAQIGGYQLHIKFDYDGPLNKANVWQDSWKIEGYSVPTDGSQPQNYFGQLDYQPEIKDGYLSAKLPVGMLYKFKITFKALVTVNDWTKDNPIWLVRGSVEMREITVDLRDVPAPS